MLFSFFLLGVAVALASQSSGQTPPSSTTSSIDLNRYPPLPQETACGDIVNANLYQDDLFFYASDAIQCLTSVPFNAAVAQRFLHYVNTTFQFHATTAYLRDPPAEYQQPSLDFFGAIQEIADNVDAGLYHNQYSFESAVQQTLQQLHDGHAEVYAGISSTMSFFSPYRLASVSSDGQQLPQVYVYDDLIAQVTSNDSVASPIVQINGIDTLEYLKDFASQQSAGMVEPHADFNQLMCSPALDIFGISTFSTAAQFYAGDQIKLSFANGTISIDRWVALFESPGYTGPLQTGGDFYNFFVLGLNPAGFAAEEDAYYQNRSFVSSDAGDGNDDESHLTSWHSLYPAYPNKTIMHQKDLGEFSDGDLTGYFLGDSSAAVLSIPSFEQYGEGIDSFSQAISDFVTNATARNAKKIIIDLQQNSGGQIALALDVFDAFFPSIRPYTGSRMRSHPLQNLLGDATTSYFQSLDPDPTNETYADYYASEWVALKRINSETGTNFTSWNEFYGPRLLNGDTFSLPEEYDLASFLFILLGLNAQFDDPCYYSNTCNSTMYWKAEDIVLLTDGLCASTCSLFVSMMRQVGVRSVVIGGLPEQGAMQAASGTRGAMAYDGDTLFNDFTDAAGFNGTARALFPQTLNDTGMQVVFAGFTLRDQIQRNTTVPDQVRYLPADCRLYWTLANFYNYTRLWEDVYTAMFVDSSHCVAGSTNVSSPPAQTGRRPSTAVQLHDAELIQQISHASQYDAFVPEIDELSGDGILQPLRVCDGIPGTSGCIPLTLGCTGSCIGSGCGKSGQRTFQIRNRVCFNSKNHACFGQQICDETGFAFNIDPQNSIAAGRRATRGYCRPQWGTGFARSYRCSQLDGRKLEEIVNGEG